MASDMDLMLARQLQEQFDREQAEEASKGILSDVGLGEAFEGENLDLLTAKMDTSLSPVDPQWETLDPNPDVRALFLEFNDRYFWGKLAGVEVRWSPRMTLCAGVCSYEGRGGLCSVRLSVPLLKLRPRKDLVETLLHEMIHALLFVTDNNKDHDGHGPEFHKHMYRINKDAKTNISVYHTFHDEVDAYRQHIWQCSGPCRSRPPYYGLVKRAMNRAPHPRDPWWSAHQQTCGGTYTKIKEPDDYGKKKSKKQLKDKSPVKPKGVPDIRNMFGGSGKAASSNPTQKGSSSSGASSASATPALPTMSTGSPTKTSSFPGSGTTLGGLSGVAKKPSPPPVTPTKDKFDDDDEGDDIIVFSPDPSAFKGKGITLGGAASSQQNDDSTRKPIVRKLPGFGEIVSERPVAEMARRADSPALRDPMTPIQPSSTQSTPGGLSVSAYPQSSSTQSTPGTKRQRQEESSDSETDILLDKVIKQKSKRRRSEPSRAKRNSIGAELSQSFVLDESFSGSTPGSVKKVPGFRSVSRTGASPPEFCKKDPRLEKEDKFWLTKSGRFTPKGGLHLLNTAAHKTALLLSPPSNMLTMPVLTKEDKPAATVIKPPPAMYNLSKMCEDFTSDEEEDDDFKKALAESVEMAEIMNAAKSPPARVEKLMDTPGVKPGTIVHIIQDGASLLKNGVVKSGSFISPPSAALGKAPTTVNMKPLSTVSISQPIDRSTSKLVPILPKKPASTTNFAVNRNRRAMYGDDSDDSDSDDDDRLISSRLGEIRRKEQALRAAGEKNAFRSRVASGNLPSNVLNKSSGGERATSAWIQNKVGPPLGSNSNLTSNLHTGLKKSPNVPLMPKSGSNTLSSSSSVTITKPNSNAEKPTYAWIQSKVAPASAFEDNHVKSTHMPPSTSTGSSSASVLPPSRSNTQNNASSSFSIGNTSGFATNSDSVPNARPSGNTAECPVCAKKVPEHIINEHLDMCLENFDDNF